MWLAPSAPPGTLFYLCIVAVGIVLRPNNWRQLEASSGAKGKAESGKKAAVEKKAVSWSVMWATDKLRVLQVVYNTTQVRALAGGKSDHGQSWHRGCRALCHSCNCDSVTACTTHWSCVAVVGILVVGHKPHIHE